jgi:flagellar motor protein MotB
MDLRSLPGPKALLTFSDFQESVGSGQPLMEVEKARRRYGPALTVHTFYLTRQSESERLAKDMAKAGGGQAWDICSLLSDEDDFESMMLTIFGSADLCYNAPQGAEVDERGCWIAAYSQFFDFNKAEVKSEFRPRLAEAARILKENVAASDQVIIAGFTDNVGSQEYNLDLGRQRAQAVADILIDEGVSSGRLSVVSYGKERPVADNGTEEGRARNRRVEFHIGAVPQAD